MLPVSILVLLALLVRAHAAALVANEELGFRLAKGFKATLFADSTLAPDIFAMTLDSKGRVVVTSHGYIKTLIDSDNDGRADQQILFAEPSSGGMGLCFDGNDLWFMGNQGLVRYRDADGNAVADAPPEKLLSSGYMEHGGHAMRKGPDGWFYFIGGNDAAFKSSEITVVNPLIRKPVAGAMLRMTEDASKVEVIAHGLRNPYDFDFNAAGDLFTYDSDVESDYFLPWYTHTRVYHLAYGGHHGWQLEGYMRSWNRPDYYPDTVDILANIGRGSPTGVITYRHGQFPEIYRNGLFILDWTFGKIFFLRLDPQGSSYRARVELFLEPIGSDGFAPSDIVVAPDGGIYVSIGGRKTRGAIYKIDFEGASSKPPPAPRTIRDVLNAPQPLDAWSRASWVGKARELGAAAFTNILSSDEHDLAGRVRAIEIHTELFGALPAATASFLTKTDKPELRARTAWALGRAPSENAATLLTLLATDREAEVRAAALEAIAQHPQLFSATALQSLLLNNFGSIDKRLRQLSAGIASALPKTEWEQLWQSEKALTPQAELTSILAALGRPEPDRDEALERITAVLTHTSEAYLRQQALRLIMIALGDWNLHKPFTEVYTAYTLAEPLKRDQRELLLPILRAAYPAPDSVSNFEISRLLAMLMDDSPETVSKTVRFFTDEANPTTEFHYLVVLSRLRGAWPEGAVDQVANTVLRLDHKLEGREQRSKQNWGKRLNEVIQKLNEREPAFAARLVADPAFPTAGHLIFTEALEGEPLRQAATIYLKQVKENTQFQWSPTLVRLLGLLPSSETFPLFTNQWENMGLRESLVIEFLKDQRPELRSFYLWGLNSPRPSIVAGSLNALLKFPPQSDRETLAALAKLFQRSFDEPRAAAIRKQGITLLRHSLGENQFWSSFQIDVEMEKRIDTVTSSTNVIKSELHSVLVPLLEGITRVNPEAVSQLQGVNWEEWRKRLSAISWESGNIKRGESVFQMRACATCHSGAGSLGPDLRGAAKRFSPEDLFAAIVVPEKDVAPPYRPIVYQTRSGQLHTGIISFSSADGVILQTGPSMNVRLDDAEIISSQPAEGSLMPSGLLDGAQSQELADLYAYLKSL